MAKLIFTSRYLRDAPPAQMENYVRWKRLVYFKKSSGGEKMVAEAAFYIP